MVGEMDELLPVEPVRPPSPARRRILAAVTLILVAAFVVVAGLEGSGFIVRSDPVPTAEATAASPARARLAYVATDGTLNVFDAGPTVHVIAPGATFQFPAWSPDRSRIAVIRTEPDGASLDVYTPPPPSGGNQDDATPPTVVYASAQEPPFYAYWAPDGRSIAFLTTEPDGIALRQAPADASQPATIVRRGAPMYWQWIDPSRLLVHSGGDAADAFAGEVGLDGASRESMAVEAGAFRAPALSADGRYVAFTAVNPDGTRSMVVASADGSSRHDLGVFGLAAFEFEPGGDSIAFVAAATAQAATDFPVGPLRVMDPATGNPRTLIDSPVVTFFWAPDGKTIAAIGIPGSDGTKTASTIGGYPAGRSAVLARADLDTTPVSAAPAATSPTLPLWFVDSATGAIRSRQSVRLSDLFIGQVIPFFDQYALSHRFWAPDSRSLVLPIVDDQDVAKIATFFPDGSDPVELVNGQFATWSP
jgi:WD40 repeat protein